MKWLEAHPDLCSCTVPSRVGVSKYYRQTFDCLLMVSHLAAAYVYLFVTANFHHLILEASSVGARSILVAAAAELIADGPPLPLVALAIAEPARSAIFALIVLAPGATSPGLWADLIIII